MAKAGRIAAALVALMPLIATRAEAAGVLDQTILVTVDNRGDIPRAAVIRAQGEATRIYEAIGARLIWTTRRRAEPAAPAALHVTISLPPRRGEERFAGDERLHKHVLGVAPPGTGRIYIFSKRVTRLARSTRQRLDVVLGRVFAHEIGHHLLPAQGHSDIGIMEATLDYRSLDAPGFTGTQADSIRTLLTPR